MLIKSSKIYIPNEKNKEAQSNLKPKKLYKQIYDFVAINGKQIIQTQPQPKQ